MSDAQGEEFWARLAAFRDALPAEEQAWVNGLVQAAYRNAPDVTGHSQQAPYALLPPLPRPQLQFGIGPSEPTTIFDPNQPAS